MVVDVPVFRIADIVGNDIVLKIIKEYGGHRVYFPKKEFEYYEQAKAFHHAIHNLKMNELDAIQYVACQFERSSKTISQHFNIGLFTSSELELKDKEYKGMFE
jgi:hypothetical protein